MYTSESFKIEALQISKKFESASVIKNFSHTFISGESYALLGPNGTGKSTLLQLLYGFTLPSSGEIVYTLNGSKIKPSTEAEYISFTAPYLELLEDFTAIEMLQTHFSFKNVYMKISFDDILKEVGLSAAKDKQIKNFSSGMKQRLKLALAIFTNSRALFLDEPCTNLDEEGTNTYHSLIERFLNNRLFIVASNQLTEYRMCKHLVHLK